MKLAPSDPVLILLIAISNIERKSCWIGRLVATEIAVMELQDGAADVLADCEE
jgi:hypothetical protein